MSQPPDDGEYGLDWECTTVRDELRGASARIDQRDARILMAHVLGIDPSRMTLAIGDPLTRRVQEAFWGVLNRRAAGEPVSHIIGKRMFYGRDFKVTADVLDPRPETEELIVAALGVAFDEVLDLGTGSGCILLTLLAERGAATGIGVDASDRALMVAKQNANDLGVADRCAFEVSDWFGAVGGTYDLIVSNPPYIAADEMDGLSIEVRHEPRIALTDEGDGLSCYRTIAAGAGDYLTAGGWLMVEIGPTQGAAVCAMFEDAGLGNVGIRTDLDGRDRVVVGQKPL